MKQPSMILFLFFPLFLYACTMYVKLPGQESKIVEDATFSFMFYNVENLFHPSDDTIRGDDEFTAAGVRHWTYKKYREKINNIAKIIRSAGSWDPPHLIGLCEIENELILKDLIFHPLLRDQNYTYLHQDSKDQRGIDVALLYQKDLFLEYTCEFISSTMPGRTKKGREILHATLGIGPDTLDVFVNHWTSKYGGAYETEEIRSHQSSILLKSVDSVLACRSCPRILITGDFNDNSGSRAINMLKEGGKVKEVLPQNNIGSYKYKGSWQLIDHFFIAGDWCQDKLFARIFSAPFLLEEDVKYSGHKPFRSYTGFKYNGGVSDHLPILLYFDLLEEEVH